MHIVIGNNKHKEIILEKYPHTKQVMYDGGYLIVAINNDKLLGFAWAFMRDIPVPVSQKELFINVIEVFEPSNYKKGIATEIIKMTIQLAKELEVYQIRAYVDINNVASNNLWVKNNFGISPVKDCKDKIPGSYVTYTIR